MKGRINALLIIGIIGTAVTGFQFATQYGQAMCGNKDIWWTPASLALHLAETKNEFQISIGGELLQGHIDRGSLSATDKDGKQYRVVSEDIKIRLNNWSKTKASILTNAVISAFALGASLVFLILGIAQKVAKRKDCEKDYPRV
jgi:hypothetical protein